MVIAWVHVLVLAKPVHSISLIVIIKIYDRLINMTADIIILDNMGPTRTPATYVGSKLSSKIAL